MWFLSQCKRETKVWLGNILPAMCSQSYLIEPWRKLDYIRAFAFFANHLHKVKKKYKKIMFFCKSIISREFFLMIVYYQYKCNTCGAFEVGSFSILNDNLGFLWDLLITPIDAKSTPATQPKQCIGIMCALSMGCAMQGYLENNNSSPFITCLLWQYLLSQVIHSLDHLFQPSQP